jgi:hypothetical protein
MSSINGAFVAESYLKIEINCATIKEGSLLMICEARAIVSGSLHNGSKVIETPYDHRWEEEYKRWNSHHLNSMSDVINRKTPGRFPDTLHSPVKFFRESVLGISVDDKEGSDSSYEVA